MSLADNIHTGEYRLAKTTKGIARATLSFSGGESKNLKKKRLRLSKLKGIRAVFVNYLTDMVYVEYDSGRITLNKIRRVLGLSPQ
jgi:hypothetical protein